MPFNSPARLDHLVKTLSADNARVTRFIDSLVGREPTAAPPQMNERPAGERADANRERQPEGE